DHHEPPEPAAQFLLPASPSRRSSARCPCVGRDRGCPGGDGFAGGQGGFAARHDSLASGFGRGGIFWTPFKFESRGRGYHLTAKRFHALRICIFSSHCSNSTATCCSSWWF